MALVYSLVHVFYLLEPSQLLLKQYFGLVYVDYVLLLI